MRNLAGALRPLLEDLASTIFFALLIAVTGNVYLATGVGIAVGIAQIAIDRLRGKEIAAMQWTSLGLVVVFGTLTLYFHDPRFVMVKFTIGHLAIGAAMLRPNWMSRYLPPVVTETLSPRVLTLYGAAWPVLMFGLAAANLYVGLMMGTQAWELFLGTVPTSSPWVLFGIEYFAIRAHVVSVRGRQHAIEAAE